ncbi:MAG: MinD/ParA family protein [bacterium]
MDQAHRLREIVQKRKKDSQGGISSFSDKRETDIKMAKGSRVIAITSGKGGVGKTNLVVNLAYSFNKLGRSVCILDADLGLANIDIILGITPKFNLKDVIFDNKSVADIMVKVNDGLSVIPASSGIQELVDLDNNQRKRLIEQLKMPGKLDDYFLIDTGAGISANVLGFVLAAPEAIIVTTPEPTSLTDAYAVIKLISKSNNRPKIRLLVNMVTDKVEGEGVFKKLNMIVKRFLNVELEYLGYVTLDGNLPRSVMKQQPIVNLYPRSEASRCFFSIASNLFQEDNINKDCSNSSLAVFWRRALSLVKK